MRKLKVLFVIDTLEGYGAEKSLVEITTSLKKIIPVFVHIYQGDMLKPKLEKAGIRVYSLNLTKKYAFNEALRKLRQIYLQERPDIVHATLFRSEIIARKLKKAFPKIYLVGSFVSNAYSTERFWKKDALDKLKLSYFQNMDRKTVLLVDQFISNSQTIKNTTTKALGIDPNKVKVIYRGRKSAEFYPQRIHQNWPFLQQEKKILLNVSRLIPLKGQLDLLKALSLVIRDNSEVLLVLAGHGNYKEYLDQQARKLGVQDHIKFLGRIDNINELLLKADIFLYPSYSEGLPGALIEAMMAERIIIASNIPENLECVDEKCALIFEKGNVHELASKILMVLKNPKAFDFLAKNARKKAIENFELEKVVGEYEDFYINAVRKENLVNSKIGGGLKLRILHLIQKPQNRGAETFASQLANHQKAAGNLVKIVSVFNGDATLPWKEPIESLKGSPNLRFIDIHAWKKLNEIIKDFKPDIIQANAGDTLKYAVMSKKLFGWQTPIVFRNASEVGKYLKSIYQKKLYSFFFKNVEAVASVSNASKRDLLQNFPFLKNRTVEIPIGLEAVKIEEEKLFSSDIKNIIHVGGFSFEKNHTGLIRIFKKVVENNCNAFLHMVGDGPLREKVEKQVQENGLSENVKFYGFVNNALPLIAQADILVLPSIIEGLPGVLLEAMYCKTPVIAFNVGGISEIITPKTGILIDEGREVEFSEAIVHVLKNSNENSVREAYELVTNKYMNKQIERGFHRLYINSI